MTDFERREVLRARADALQRESNELRRIADELYPLTEDERTEREIQDDDDALHSLLMRVWRTVDGSPGISAEQVSKAMGLPNSYPSEGSNYLTLQLLVHLEQLGMVEGYRGRKPFEWTARPIAKRVPVLVRIK